MLTRRSLFARLSAVALATSEGVWFYDRSGSWWPIKNLEIHTTDELLAALTEFERRSFDAMIKDGEEYLYGGTA